MEMEMEMEREKNGEKKKRTASPRNSISKLPRSVRRSGQERHAAAVREAKGPEAEGYALDASRGLAVCARAAAAHVHCGTGGGARLHYTVQRGRD